MLEAGQEGISSSTGLWGLSIPINPCLLGAGGMRLLLQFKEGTVIAAQLAGWCGLNWLTVSTDLCVPLSVKSSFIIFVRKEV